MMNAVTDSLCTYTPMYGVIVSFMSLMESAVDISLCVNTPYSSWGMQVCHLISVVKSYR